MIKNTNQSAYSEALWHAQQLNHLMLRLSFTPNSWFQRDYYNKRLISHTPVGSHNISHLSVPQLQICSFLWHMKHLKCLPRDQCVSLRCETWELVLRDDAVFEELRAVNTRRTFCSISAAGSSTFSDKHDNVLQCPTTGQRVTPEGCLSSTHLFSLHSVVWDIYCLKIQKISRMYTFN